LHAQRNQAAVNRKMPVVPPRFFQLAQAPRAPSNVKLDQLPQAKVEKNAEIVSEKTVAINNSGMSKEQAQQILSIFHSAD